MREILFRGKTDAGKWVYGDLLHPDLYGNGYAIDDFNIPKDNCFDVIPETIGQYTGLTDKNGKKIFEGDILKGMGGLHRVYFDTSLACFEWQKISGNWHESFSGFADEYEIIGNIHDNPELLKGGEG